VRFRLIDNKQVVMENGFEVINMIEQKAIEIYILFKELKILLDQRTVVCLQNVANPTVVMAVQNVPIQMQFILREKFHLVLFIKNH
jgi:hypothetical protein